MWIADMRAEDAIVIEYPGQPDVIVRYLGPGPGRDRGKIGIEAPRHVRLVRDDRRIARKN